jgi:hypothetical protein
MSGGWRTTAYGVAHWATEATDQEYRWLAVDFAVIPGHITNLVVATSGDQHR